MVNDIEVMRDKLSRLERRLDEVESDSTRHDEDLERIHTDIEYLQERVDILGQKDDG